MGGDLLGITRTAAGFDLEAAGIFVDLAAIPGLVQVRLEPFEAVFQPATFVLLAVGMVVVAARRCRV